MRGSLENHRIDRDATQRRARAQAHLHRLRRNRHGARPTGRRRTVLVVAVAGLCGLLFGDALRSAFGDGAQRPLEMVAVRGADHLSPLQVARAAGIAEDTTAAEIEGDELVRALQSHDWIAQADTLSLPGGTLLLGVVEREPVATLAIQDTLYAVDAEGAPFAPLEAAPPGLIQLRARAEVQPREPSAQLAEGVRLARRLSELGLAPPTEVEVAAPDDPEGFALRLAALPARVVLGHEDLDARLDDLIRLLAARPDAVAQATFIDLRFANQVVLWSGPAREGSANTAAGRGNVPPRNRRPTG